MRRSTRTYLLISVAVLLLGLVSLIVWRSRSKTSLPVPIALPEISQSELHASWNREVEDALQQYKQDKNALAARDRLLALRVAADDRETHLKLVLALQALTDKQRDGAVRLKEAEQKFALDQSSQK